MAFVNPNLLTDPASFSFEGGTHTWTDATSNTTLSVVTGQFLTGTYSLKFLAKATGSVQAYSPYVTGIQVGKTYFTRIPARIQAAYAGKTFTARIEYYNASGTVTGTTDYAVSPSATSTGWVQSNYPAVSAVAPANTTKARVSFIAAGITINDYVNIDDVYFGEAPLIPGNLYGYDAQSLESGIDKWGVSGGTPGTLSAGFGTRYDGFRCVGITAVVTGTQFLRTNATVPVTPNAEYVAHGWVFSPVTTTGDVLIQWYDAGGAALTTSSVSSSLTAGAWNVQLVVATAPSNAATARLYFRPVALSVGDQFFMDEAALRVAPNVAGNLLTYDEYSTESTLPAWTITNGTPARSGFTSVYTDGFYALKVAPTAPGMINGQLNRLIPVTPGTTYKVKGTVLRHNTNTAQSITYAARFRVDWYTAAGNLFQADNPDQLYQRTAPEDWIASIVSETRTCPAGAAFAKVGFDVDSTSPLIDSWAFDSVQLVVSTPEYSLVTNNELGLVTLTLNNVYATSNAITIERVDEDGNKSALRGYGVVYDKAPYTPGPIVVEDYEAPLGSKVWYAISMFTGTASGNRLLTQRVDAPVLADADYVWLKSPGIPALNTQVMMEAPLKWSRASRSATFDVVGRKNPVHITSKRGGRTASATILVWDPADNALFDSLLDSGLPALIQAMPGYGIEGNLYVSIGDSDVDPLSPDAREAGWRWTLALTEIDRPEGGLQGSAASTWQTIMDTVAYATWEDLFNSHDAWTDVLTKG
ncbi:hypothetical protein [Streptomyces sp. NPDC055006]